MSSSSRIQDGRPDTAILDSLFLVSHPLRTALRVSGTSPVHTIQEQSEFSAPPGGEVGFICISSLPTLLPPTKYFTMALRTNWSSGLRMHLFTQRGEGQTHLGSRCVIPQSSSQSQAVVDRAQTQYTEVSTVLHKGHLQAPAVATVLGKALPSLCSEKHPKQT